MLRDVLEDVLDERRAVEEDESPRVHLREKKVPAVISRTRRDHK
jgi:hypothetical protein